MGRNQTVCVAMQAKRMRRIGAKWVSHLAELLWGCACLPEVGKARVNNRVLKNCEFSRHHIRRL